MSDLPTDVSTPGFGRRHIEACRAVPITNKQKEAIRDLFGDDYDFGPPLKPLSEYTDEELDNLYMELRGLKKPPDQTNIKKKKKKKTGE